MPTLRPLQGKSQVSTTLSSLTRTTQHQETVVTICQKMEPWWAERPEVVFLCCQKAAAKAETFLNSLPASPPSNPQTPTSQSQKTQNGHILEKGKSKISSAHRARGRACTAAAEKMEPCAGSCKHRYSSSSSASPAPCCLGDFAFAVLLRKLAVVAVTLEFLLPSLLPPDPCLPGGPRGKEDARFSG